MNMKHLKYFNQLNEGHITLTPEEHKSVERLMKKMAQLLSVRRSWALKLKCLKLTGDPDNDFKYIKNIIDSGSTDIVYVDSIDYVTATGIKSKVGIYIVVCYGRSFKGLYLPGNTSDSQDNIILINQEYTQEFRHILMHELIHAKDPKINQLFTDKFKKNAFKENYYKRRHEFEAFTGQLLNGISNSTYKFLKEGWSSKELKEIFDDILEHFKDTKQDFINSFEKQNPDFMKTITNKIEGMPKSLFTIDYSKIPGIDKFVDRTKLKTDTLMFLNREWDKNKKISSETTEDLSKVANDQFISRTDKLKEINSDYSEFLKDLYKEIKKQVDFVNSKEEEEKIELNYKTMSDWMNACKNASFMSRTKIKKV